MPSEKIKIWDFIGKIQKGVVETACLVSSESFHHFLMTRCLKSLAADWKVIWAEDLTREKIQEIFWDLSLFVSEEKYIIYEMERLSKDLIKQMEEVPWHEKKIILCYGKKQTAGYKKICQKGPVFEIDPEKSWETPQMLDFCFSFLEIEPITQLAEYYKQKPAQSLSVLWTQVQRVALVADIKRMTIQEISELLDGEDADLFKIGDSFTEKKMHDFLISISESIDLKKDFLFKLFHYLRNMLIKTQEIAEIQNERNLSFYEKKIKRMSHLFSYPEILIWLKRISEWEILLKKDPEELKRSLSRQRLQTT